MLSILEATSDSHCSIIRALLAPAQLAALTLSKP